VVVPRLKALCPALGKVKLAQILARAGLHLGVTTVGRMLKATPSKPGPADAPAEQAMEAKTSRIVTAKRPNHLWHVDLTVFPLGGFWAPWLPFALPQRGHSAGGWLCLLTINLPSHRAYEVHGPA
jgi:hypothetical protein